MLFSFSDHVALLDQLLNRRTDVVEGIESHLLNVRGKDLASSRDRRRFERVLDSCVFGLQGLPTELSRLKGQLLARHLADGFEPVQVDESSNELDPLELIVRAYHYWERHRWPGKAGRLTYAQTIYAVFMLHQLELLSLRMWDDGHDLAEGRLRNVQRLLDRLNDLAIPVVFVRDARWLIQTAQGPFTRHLEPYLKTAEQIGGSFTDAVRLGIHEAGAKMAGGHLRSQLRYRMWSTGRPIEDPENLAFTRNSNSMDVALLVRDLVPLLEAYLAADLSRNVDARLELADAILQGLSADPELLLTRLDLLTPCTMIEDLFIASDADGRARYTPMGEAHVAHLDRYVELIGQLAASLKTDAAQFDPGHHGYSPYGIAYGFAVDLLSNMAVATLLSQPSFDFSFEDVFASRGRLEHKLTRARGWEALPKREGEREHFDHSGEFAEQTFARLMQALEARILHPGARNASPRPDVQLYVVPASDDATLLPEGFPPAGVSQADEYCFTSNVQRALSGAATAWPRRQMLTDRKEGRYLSSVECDGEWFAISKAILTLLMSQGFDAVISGVPPAAIEALRLTCPGLIKVPVPESS